MDDVNSSLVLYPNINVLMSGMISIGLYSPEYLVYSHIFIKKQRYPGTSVSSRTRGEIPCAHFSEGIGMGESGCVPGVPAIHRNRYAGGYFGIYPVISGTDEMMTNHLPGRHDIHYHAETWSRRNKK